MLKRKTTVEYHSKVFDFIFLMLYRTVNCYLKCLGPFIEIWCCKMNALSLIRIHFETIFTVQFFHCFYACLCIYFQLLVIRCATEQELNIICIKGCTSGNFYSNKLILLKSLIKILKRIRPSIGPPWGTLYKLDFATN